MSLAALARFAGILAANEKVETAPFGYAAQKVRFAVELSREGELTAITPLATPVAGRKRTSERPWERLILPLGARPSNNVAAQFLWGNPTYALGVSLREEDLGYIEPRFREFRAFNLPLLAGVEGETAQAVRAFLQRYKREELLAHPAVQATLDALRRGGSLALRVEGAWAHEDPALRRAWEAYLASQTDQPVMQCLVTGERAPIARLHAHVRGVPGTRPTGAALVSFSAPASESQGYEQGLNAPVSEAAAAAYASALDFLLSERNPNRPLRLGDSSVLYWAESTDNRYAAALGTLLAPWDEPDFSTLLADLDPGVPCCVLALAPASGSRLAQRLFLRAPFGSFAAAALGHYADTEIERVSENQPRFLGPAALLQEATSPKAGDRQRDVAAAWSPVGAELLRAVLTGSPYPFALYDALLERMRHESGEDARNQKVTYARAALVKGYLTRQHHSTYQEALTVSLNPDCSVPAYLLGRLYAVLERARQDALHNTKVSFTPGIWQNASTRPASAFPTLLAQGKAFMARGQYGGYWQRQVEALLDRLPAEPFPPRLSLEEQGLFALGYYHQRAAFFQRQETGEEEAPSEISEETEEGES